MAELAELAEIIGMDIGTLSYRVRKYGVAKAVTMPVKRHRVTLDGETMYLKAAARKLGVSYDTVLRRVKHGWSAERAVTTPTPRMGDANAGHFPKRQQ